MLKKIGLTMMLLLAFALSTRGAEPHEGTAQPAAAEKHEVIEFSVPTAIWVVVIFLVLLIVLYPTAWKGVLEGLKKREERIRKDIADAETARDRASATLREYQAQLATAENKVREMIAGATAQGEKMAADIRLRAQQESEEGRQRAMRDIDAARQQALTEIYERAAEISTNIAEKILRKNISVDDQRELVRRSLQELQSVGNEH